ncbi:unnamed protein product [Adineta steineri]|uniref:Uncharacterized protein n=1 Tax=Adineta steineri TaxID=433720 RepID=A0A819CE66_9BILA|nr:unnamed protein product [Adineta steineri]
MNQCIGYLFILSIVKTKNVGSLHAKNQSRFLNDNDEDLSDETSDIVGDVCVIIAGFIILFLCLYWQCLPTRNLNRQPHNR